MSMSAKEHRMTKHELARKIATDAAITARQDLLGARVWQADRQQQLDRLRRTCH